jgi:TonB-linked outer membrane protein, SusC/RagA family
MIHKTRNDLLCVPLKYIMLMKLAICLLITCSLSSTAFAAVDPIHGVVRSENGELLERVTVTVKGKKISTVTNALGEFTIDANLGDVLVFSYVGYAPLEVPAANANGKTMTMIQARGTAADSVVVVGFGRQKKISVVGAISTVPMKIVIQTSTPNLSTAIAGKLPGIISRQESGEPGYDQTQIYIRGMATFGAGTNRSPLILVDGIERDMNTINAQEVESISVLKDASASAVFGVRGANGVILITTKSGRLGKPQVTLRSEYARMTGLRAPQFINGGEYASLINENRINERMRDPNIQLKYSDEEIQKFYDQSDPYLYPSVDWSDAVLNKNTHQTINNLSVTGGNPVLKYYLNLGYTQQDGLWKRDPQYKYNTNSTVNRYNLRSRVDVNITKELTMDLGLGVIFSQNNHPGYTTQAIFDALTFISPIQFPKYNPDGTISGTIVNTLTNPWGMVSNSGYIVRYNNQTQGTLGVKWDLSEKITPGLSLRGRFAYDHNSSGYASRLISYEIKSYQGKDPLTGEDKYKVDYEARRQQYSTGATSSRSFYTEAVINYEREFGKHSVTGMLMGNLRDAVDILAPISRDNIPAKRVGLANRITYGYDNRYLLEFNAGYNGSENFMKGYRFGFFPSISGGWIVSNEKFWGAGNPINSLKFRGSYGLLGNDQIGGRRFMFLTSLKTAGTNFYNFGSSQTAIIGIEEDYIGLPDVTWEKTRKANIGFDMGLFNNALTWQVDIFEENRKDILLQRVGSIPLVSGFLPNTLPFANLGKAYNHGVESLIEFRKSTKSGFTYSLRSNFTFARNHIVENDEAPMPYAYQSLKGLPIGTSLGYVALGFFEDQADIDKSPKQKFSSTVMPGDVKYQDINGDGVIDNYDRVPLGYPRDPEIVYGFGGTVAYKGFDMSVYFTGAARSTFFFMGGTVYPFSKGEGSYNVQREFYEHRWIAGADNTNAKYPAVRYSSALNNYNVSTLYMRNGSYLRLKTAELGYSLSQQVLNRIKINSLRIFINGTNLITWDDLKIVDPENNNGSGWYPLQRVVNGGFQVTF